jgi:hypothetical protein
MKVDLDTVSDSLNSDIDAIRDALARQPPVGDLELRRLIGRLNTTQWADKLRLIEELVQKTFLAVRALWPQIPDCRTRRCWSPGSGPKLDKGVSLLGP